MKAILKKALIFTLALACVLSALVSCDKTVPSADEVPNEQTNPTPETPVTEDPKVLTDFERYVSNTSAATGHNWMLTSESSVTETFRAIYKVQEAGQFDYKFFFSNNVNSTNNDCPGSYREMPTHPYVIESARVGTTSRDNDTRALKTIGTGQDLSFGGQASRSVEPKECFWSDAISINVPQNQYLIFEWTVTYTAIPATEIGTTMRGLKKNANNSMFSETRSVPMPDLIGCDRGVKVRVGFIGDSITMGAFSGATTSSKATYEFWAAKVAEGLGNDASVWNLGLGYARGDDAANSESWLYKAKQCDVVGICFGVNDINSGVYGSSNPATAQELVEDVSKIASELEAAGVKVIIFSTPPYTFSSDSKFEIWRQACAGLKELAEQKGYDFFDIAAHLGKEDAPHLPAYGHNPNDGHPNNVGCAKVAEAFLAANLIKIPED